MRLLSRSSTWAVIALLAGAGTAVALLAPKQPSTTADGGPTVHRPKRCLAADGCFPKPPGHGLGSTGVPPGTKLESCGHDATISTEGAVIDRCRYTGTVLIAANGVSIRRSRIYGAIRAKGGGPNYRFSVSDSDIGPDRDCGSLEALIGIENYVARRNYLHGNGDGFRLAGDDITIEGNFVATCDLPGDHSDGIQAVESRSNIVVDHNTIDLRGSTHGPNAPLFFADDAQSGTLTNNLLISSDPLGPALRVHDDHSPDVGPWVVTGNRLVGSSITTNTDCRGAKMTWGDNRRVTVARDYEITSLARRPVVC